MKGIKIMQLDFVLVAGQPVESRQFIVRAVFSAARNAAGYKLRR
jgi:hypothetical protein